MPQTQVVAEILSGDRSNFWTIKESNNHSWLVKRLLRLREWKTHSDNWSPHGNMADFLHLQPHSRLGIPRHATVSDLFVDGYWILPPARSEASSPLSLKHQNLTVPWFNIIWLRQGIPKHSFLTWLLLLDRCPTRDRLLSWGLPTDPSCLLCNHAATLGGSGRP
ncbi:hypothetical protein HID58_028251 [Brassica napus]|uniref:Reverse transcriptase zinc-binding domain-containing protein n=1 Tax=Brassica napus TaxID=3708 RepID=A0ABQ8C9N8_BRANA|nr:hypothetical protein HID58_028251 [Brassica napus]